jgi:hypothetical protein
MSSDIQVTEKNGSYHPPTSLSKQAHTKSFEPKQNIILTLATLKKHFT